MSNEPLLQRGHFENLKRHGVELNSNTEQGLLEVLDQNAPLVFRILLQELMSYNPQNALTAELKDLATEAITKTSRLIDISKRFINLTQSPSKEKAELSEYLLQCEANIPAWQERLNKLS